MDLAKCDLRTVYTEVHPSCNPSLVLGFLGTLIQRNQGAKRLVHDNCWYILPVRKSKQR